MALVVTTWLFLLLQFYGAGSIRTEGEENVSMNMSHPESTLLPFSPLIGNVPNEMDKHGSTVTRPVASRFQHRAWQRLMLAQRPKSLSEILLAIGGGTGAGADSGNPEVDADILVRMQCQDKIVLLLLLLGYFVALMFTASLIYKQATNTSRIIYYADPRCSDAVLDNKELEDFLDVFNQPPVDVQLQVQGLVPLPALMAHVVDDSVEWQGLYYRYAFSYSLDVTPWLEAVEHDVEDGDGEDLKSGMTEKDLQCLSDFLANDNNDLGTVEIQQHVVWPAWEELAQNIKHKIRQSGFSGVIHVNFKQHNRMVVYKNMPWANFLHRSSTKVLCGLSLFGYLWYLPYMWIRMRGPRVHSKFHINVDIDRYWELISNKISAEGFRA